MINKAVFIGIIGYNAQLIFILALSNFMVSPNDKNPNDNNNIDKIAKPSKSQYLSQHTAGVLTVFGVSVLIVAIIGLIFGLKIGYSRGLSHATAQIKQAADGEEISARNVKALKLKVDTLQNQVQTAQQERDISLANLEDLRDEMANLRVTNLQLEQGNGFLTESLAKKGGMPLQVIASKIVPLPENAYEYRFDIGMVDTSNSAKNLTPKLTLLDDVNMVEVPIQPRQYDINGVARIRGRFVMPNNFTPKQVKLELSAGGQTAEEIYDWQFGKPVADMPYSLEESPESDKRPISVIEEEAKKKQDENAQR